MKNNSKPSLSAISSIKTAKAAKKFTRRTLLKTSAGAGLSVAAYGPWYVKDAFSSSGECNIFVWTGNFPKSIVDRMRVRTGIKINVTEIKSNEQLLNKLKSTRGRGYDLITPTLSMAAQWKDLNLLQPWELEKLPMDRVDQRFLTRSQNDWTWYYGLFHLPHLWGTEAIGYRTDLYETTYGKLSLGDLWHEDVKGKIMGRPHSLMAGIGRYLASIGEMAPFEDSYKDEDSMRDIWSTITDFAIDHKDWIRLFWNDATTQQAGLRRNGIVLGQVWDSPVITMKNKGEPVNYLAPKEGAFARLDGFAMPTGAANIDQAYELIKVCYDPAFAGSQATYTGSNSVVAGSDHFMSDLAKTVHSEAYPKDALDKLWWWPSEPQWYADIKAEYRDAYIAA